jgi:hypothetical protein
MTRPADRALVPWWCLAAAALVGVWAVRPIERVLPPDLVLFGRAGTVYHLRASPPADRVRLAPDVRTLEKARDERRDSPRLEESAASGDVLEVPNGTAARALKVVEDEFHRPVMRVQVLEGPHEGKRGYVWRSALGRPTPWRVGPLTLLEVLAAAVAMGIAFIVRAIGIVAAQRPPG